MTDICADQDMEGNALLTIDRYVKAQSLKEAYELCQKRNNVVLGGMLWLKMQDRKVGAAIDLCGLGLDQITEREDAFEIGAMVSLRELEKHPGLNELTGGAISNSVEHIVGVQFRNCATVGGSVFGRFGFSDVLTILMALGARVELYHAGVMPLADFCESHISRDILTKVIVPKGVTGAVYLSQRNSATDFPLLACAIVRREEEYQVAVGARPMVARSYTDERGLLAGGITREIAQAFALELSQRVKLGGNALGSEESRRALCPVLVRRGLLKLEGVE